MTTEHPPSTPDRAAIEAEYPAGWGWPGNSRKCHYFRAGDSQSVCGRWGFFWGRREADEGTSKDDCAACRKMLDKERSGV